ncbi:MAG: general secretion pathway protein GspK [Verrucomicrobia bacterium]|nr:general secretion pathway protein GspK [Verrucomicrobiota bacterium]
MRRLRKVRGSVLIIVMVTLLFTTFAMVTFVEKAGVDLLVEVRESSARHLRQKAYSALEVTLAVLEDFRQADGGLRSPAEGWNDPLGFANWTPGDGYTADVSFEDESGKISLAHVTPATLTELFKSWQFSQSDAEKLTDGLMSWMQKDYVPTGSFTPDYDNGALPYVVPQRSLRSFSELAAIDAVRDVFYDKDGRPNEYWHRFANTFSLFDFKQSNLNAATPDVLSAFGNSDLSSQQRLGEYLSGTGAYANQGPGFFQNSGDAASVLGGNSVPAGFGTVISALRINITIHRGRTQFRLTAVVAPPGGASTVLANPALTALPDDKNPDKTATTQQPSTSASTGVTTTTTAGKKLNYPFTLLEIRENVEIPPTPAPAPQA